MKKPLYKVLASKIEWRPAPGSEWEMRRSQEITRLLDLLPSGSGWDCGTKLDEKATILVEVWGTPRCQRIVLYGEFHHMNKNGFYDDWTDHTVIVTPSLSRDFDLRITGKDRNDIKEYLYEIFYYALRQDVEEYQKDEQKEVQ